MPAIGGFGQPRIKGLRAICLAQIEVWVQTGPFMRPPGAAERKKGRREPACKPGSVEDSHSSWACVAARLQRPTRELVWAHCKRSPIRSCFGWGLPCHRCYHLRGALLPHHFTLTGLTAGGIFSAALSVGSRPPGVTWHPAQRSPDFPPGLLPATARPTPSDRLAERPVARERKSCPTRHEPEREAVIQRDMSL